MNELKTIFVEENAKTFLDKEIKFRTFSVGDLPKIITIVDKFTKIMEKHAKHGAKSSEFMIPLSQEIKTVSDLLLITTSLTQEEINKLNPAGLVIITSEVIKQNFDFLQENVIPLLNESFKAMAKDGLDKSKS